MKNVHYINAGAGAGKTFTLVTKLKDILTDKHNPCAPSEIILTTYTKAAAKEFREKTFKRLLEAPAALDVAKILDTATIGTVHSVAQQYIQRYWTLLYYSGQFNVMSDVDKKRYINQSLKNSVKPEDLSFFYEFTKDFNVTKYDAAKRINRANYDFWKEYVLEIVSKMRAYDIDATKLKSFAKQSCDVVDRLFVHDFNLATFQSIAKDYLNALDNIINTSNGNSKSAAQKKRYQYDDFCHKPSFTKETLKEFSNSNSDFYKYQSKIKGDPAAMLSGDNSKKYIQKCFVLNSDNGIRVKDCINRIFTIAETWSQKFEQYKRDNSLLDFDDLEAKFLELLDKPAVQKDISSSIKYVFVDEFQDSNPIQLEIFKKLSDLVQKSYWVGDRKQAIYGFRGSDSSLTTKLLSSFPIPVPKQTTRFIPNIDGCTTQLIDTSYRSVRNLVELSNEVFEKSFASGAPSEIIDKKNVPLCVKRENGKIDKPIQHWDCNSVDALADRVAEILNGNVTTFPGVYDDDDNWHENIVPADIAVLSRTGTEVAAIEAALRKKGVPVSSPETSILDKAEVKLVFALLKYVASIKRRYAKTELAKLLEDKEIGSILDEIAKGRYDYNPYFDEDDKDPKIESEDSKADEKKDDAVAASKKAPKQDPDPFFADLNDKLQGLRGLNISAMVKGVIAVMDVRNIVAKWENAEIRQDNLDTLIEQAIAYEQSTAHSIETASVAGFLQYMKNLELKAELDQSAKGVKVATYHKSKGLQWKIVILNSLNYDELELTNFVGKSWFALNLKGGFGSAELQLIPNCGDVSDVVADTVKELSLCSSGSDDNGYFNMRYGQVTGEIKRLLYVGVTRARDYLVTTSFPSGKEKTTKPLAWIKNVLEKPAPVALDTPDGFPDKSTVDIWGVSGYEAYYEKLEDNGHTYTAGATAALKLPQKDLNSTTEAKTISPSSSHERIQDVTPTLVEDFKSDYIEHGTIKDSAAFGTCIHNYFAAHRWEGKEKIGNHESCNKALADKTIVNHGMESILLQPELLVNAADSLFTYLEEQYGPGELLRETPFTYRLANGQLVTGEIDLVWKTADKCVLVDYKNFPANKEWGMKIVLEDTPKNDFYVGKYFQQLDYYRAALTAAGLKVTDVYIFYAVLGCLVKVEFGKKREY